MCGPVDMRTGHRAQGKDSACVDRRQEAQEAEQGRAQEKAGPVDMRHRRGCVDKRQDRTEGRVCVCVCR